MSEAFDIRVASGRIVLWTKSDVGDDILDGWIYFH